MKLKNEALDSLNEIIEALTTSGLRVIANTAYSVQILEIENLLPKINPAVEKMQQTRLALRSAFFQYDYNIEHLKLDCEKGLSTLMITITFDHGTFQLVYSNHSLHIDLRYVAKEDQSNSIDDLPSDNSAAVLNTSYSEWIPLDDLQSELPENLERPTIQELLES